MMQKLPALIVLFASLVTTTVMGQIQYPHQKKWEFSFLGGAAFSSDESSATPVSGEDSLRLVRLHFASGYLVGVRVSENLGQKVAAELEYSFANHPLGFFNLTPDVPLLDADHRTHSILYNITYSLRPRMSKLRPFFGFGAGTTFFQIDGNSKTAASVEGIELKDRWKFAFGLTGGVKSMINENWGLRVDVRNLWTGVPDYGLPASATPSGPGFNAEGLLSRWQISGGISYYWGK